MKNKFAFLGALALTTWAVSCAHDHDHSAESAYECKLTGSAFTKDNTWRDASGCGDLPTEGVKIRIEHADIENAGAVRLRFFAANTNATLTNSGGLEVILTNGNAAAQFNGDTGSNAAINTGHADICIEIHNVVNERHAQIFQNDCSGTPLVDLEADNAPQPSGRRVTYSISAADATFDELHISKDASGHSH